MRRLAVTALAEFVHRRGDLHSSVDARTRAEEGISAQRRLQRGMPEGYQIERRVEANVVIAGHDYRLGGRIDGCQADACLIEEYKATRGDPAKSHAQNASVHWAQTRLYGALLAQELGVDPDQPWILRLVYVHPDSLRATCFEEQATTRQLTGFFADTLAWYDAWLVAQHQHLRHRDTAIAELRFPFANYRPHQRALAQRAYQALRDQEALLLEAPTGSGKTMGVLFPALKALPAATHQRLFYLTSRTTGANAARQACERLDSAGEYLRVIQITAKAQACAAAGERCGNSECQYAQGYYDRIHDAVRDLLARCAMTPDTITAVAHGHRVCPFELSLDAARWADVIIGDYNYVFDPLVRLQRFADDQDMALLVDESHQLSARTQDMLSLELPRSLVRAALAEAIPEELARRLRAVDRQLRNIKTVVAGEPEIVSEPAGLITAIQRLVETLGVTEVNLAAFPQTQEACFECVRWARSRSWYEPETCIYVACVQRQRRGVVHVRLRLVHLDPGAYLAQVLAGYAGHIRFSGTVSPLSLYQRLHGLPNAPAERAGSPFAPSQLAVCIVDDVPTLYRQRSAGLPGLAQLIRQVAASRPGNYLVAFPSFEYLNACAEVLRGVCPQLALLAQAPDMSADEKAQFLAELQQTDTPLVAMVVLGGVFAESVDLADQGATTLTGVICVGAGLPPPSLEREAMARYFNEAGEDGAAIAYRQPAMNKVLQVAGRLLRDPGDRGVLVLVDARFREPAYQQFFPAHWQPVVVGSAAIAAKLEKFWQPSAASPRLPAAPSPAVEPAG